jgi:lipoprotein NlpD
MAGKRNHTPYNSFQATRLPLGRHFICKVLIIVSIFAFTACTSYLTVSKPASGVYHRVKKGDTLSKIAQVYHISLQQLAEANNIEHTDMLSAGRVLFIPDAQAIADDVLVAVKAQEADKQGAAAPVISKKRPVKNPDGGDKTAAHPAMNQQASQEKNQSPPTTPKKPEIALPSADKTAFPLKLSSVAPKEGIHGDNPSAEAEQTKIQRENNFFRWPVAGKVVSRYGIQPNGMFFNGIRIAAPEGTAVVAAADGSVIFSAPLKDYGETIILKHDNDYTSVYTQLGQRLVKRDDRLKKGDKIGTVARPEVTGESQLNFEIRLKNKARNPLFFLP